MKVEVFESEQGNYNLQDYEKTYQDFDWDEVKKAFSRNETGKINMAYECIDRHVDNGKGDKIALNYRDEKRKEQYSFKELKVLSNKAANVLVDKANVQKGDRVFIFMPRTPELYFAFLGILKIGAIVGPLFEAFMEKAVTDRLENSEAKVIVTTNSLLGRIPKDKLPHLETIVVVDDEVDEQYVDFNKELNQANEEFDIEWLKEDDGLILHYTSGSTGQPKGVLHVQKAMLLHYISGKYVLDLKEGDIYWCTADPGWVTGTSYGVFAPWLNGVTNCIAGGRFSPEQWYSMIETFKVTIWYTAPTALRMLMSAGDDVVEKYDLSSLRSILSVGEPLNPEVIKWSKDVYDKRVLDTWWMTETGGHMIVNYPAVDVKLGSMGKPLPGIEAAIIDDSGNVLPPNRMGNLAIKKGWPSMMYSIWKNPEKYNSYFIGDWYVSGDSAYQDEEGYFWFQGRVDDVIMTAGERVGPFEVESKLVEHEAVAEAGVIGKPDPVRGEIIKAFISLRQGYEPSDELKADIRKFVKEGLSGHAAPREIEFKDKLPKTRSGKIMRRVLKAWELNLDAGDLSTMED
ncbi:MULTISPECIES: acetate--CoA ligase [Staphylococcus]|uniref:Putative long chain fatty acid-CoA ligase VraA n=1 Tax=Staphylococcus haemolyticus TaxID=1283 RepID=A0A2K0A7A8_STAHA|nr:MULTISPECIES: acetate--CoA ligase [Staphylococcus]KGF27162.1 acetyl-CoA synthetase [Staphylococcus haemolyticus DNF00585]MCH4443831.1 acetate--CoA ligase [Staphylococcus haemolyticus]OFK34716.1 acetate--CoA ligase [Staphylococcus sp. HMSC065C10]OFL88865.1 acetate--CoA ligase [Staphylococcus sp. HMSC069D12]PNN20911.1 acetate--CoA ligase [Staphylococcus haemolyticus]